MSLLAKPIVFVNTAGFFHIVGFPCTGRLLLARIVPIRGGEPRGERRYDLASNRVVLAVFFGPWYQGPDNGTRALVRRSLMVYQSPILNGLGATGLRCYQGVLPGSFLKLVSGIQLC